jgi:hypothetical protein
MSKYNAGHSAHLGVAGGTDPCGNSVGISTTVPTVNLFKDPVAVRNQVRAPILGIDTTNPGVGQFMGQSTWNLNGQLKKDTAIRESMTFELSFIATNMPNHRVFYDPGLRLASPTSWGVLSPQQSNPREMEFGGRFTFQDQSRGRRSVLPGPGIESSAGICGSLRCLFLHRRKRIASLLCGSASSLSQHFLKPVAQSW